MVQICRGHRRQAKKPRRTAPSTNMPSHTCKCFCTCATHARAAVPFRRHVTVGGERARRNAERAMEVSGPPPRRERETSFERAAGGKGPAGVEGAWAAAPTRERGWPRPPRVRRAGSARRRARVRDAIEGSGAWPACGESTSEHGAGGRLRACRPRAAGSDVDRSAAGAPLFVRPPSPSLVHTSSCGLFLVAAGWRRLV